MTILPQTETSGSGSHLHHTGKMVEIVEEFKNLGTIFVLPFPQDLLYIGGEPQKAARHYLLRRGSLSPHSITPSSRV